MSFPGTFPLAFPPARRAAVTFTGPAATADEAVRLLVGAGHTVVTWPNPYPPDGVASVAVHGPDVDGPARLLERVGWRPCEQPSN